VIALPNASRLFTKYARTFHTPLSGRPYLARLENVCFPKAPKPLARPCAMNGLRLLEKRGFLNGFLQRLGHEQDSHTSKLTISGNLSGTHMLLAERK
jgi:hypothetical protein